MISIKEKSLNDLKKFICSYDTSMLVESKSGQICESLQLVNEQAGLTYYELRQFLTILLKQSGNSEVKRLIDNILKTVSKLEIMKVPVPNLLKNCVILSLVVVTPNEDAKGFSPIVPVEVANSITLST